MEIILLERVGKLGQIGDVVTVKTGYARNYLLPQKKALRSNKANLAIFEAQRTEIEANNLEAKTEAEAVAAKMANVSAVIIRQAGESGNLYGSVSSRDVVLAIEEQGFKIARSQVVLDHSIKTLGIYSVAVKLHAEVRITVSINVARSAEEAVMQVKGVDAKTAEAEAEDISVEDYFENEDDAAAANASDEEETSEEVAAEEVVAEEAAPEASEEETKE